MGRPPSARSQILAALRTEWPLPVSTRRVCEDVDPTTTSSDTVELLTMIGGEIRWLFLCGYVYGAFAIYDRQNNQMRVVSEVDDIDADSWASEYLVWIPPRRGRDFARKAIRAIDMYHGPGAEQ